MVKQQKSITVFSASRSEVVFSAPFSLVSRLDGPARISATARENNLVVTRKPKRNALSGG